VWVWLAAVLFYAWAFALLFLSPLIFLYMSFWCVIGPLLLARRGKDVVFVYNGTHQSGDQTSTLTSLVADRAALLDYAERRQWKRWSLPVHLYTLFGPMSIPQRLTPGVLPAVIVFRRFRWPKTFSFGQRSKELEERMVLLRSELARPLP